MKIYTHTFGCRVNQYETQLLRERMLAEPAVAAEVVSDWESADLCVVNTCTVTREADKDALRLIRRIGRRNPAARLVVTGCLASRAPREILEAAPHALVAGNDAKERIPAMLGCGAAPATVGITGFHGRVRAFVKIQDGCNMHCTYCVIPSVRPRLWCKPAAVLEAEVRGLVERGVREVVLCGVRLGRYLSIAGDGRRVDFAGMIERLARLPGDFRIRLSSLEVTDLTDRFLDCVLAPGGRLAPSFHVPLQSGSEAVLRRMQRWYTAAFYGRRTRALLDRCPEAGLFADVMAGFPGETQAEFEESLRFASEAGFSGLHVFRYSPRSGTPAAVLPGQLPEEVVRERVLRMQALDGELRRTFAARNVGRRRLVLVERGGVGAEGLTEHFLRVRFGRDPGDGMVPAFVTGCRGEEGEAVALDPKGPEGGRAAAPCGDGLIFL